MSTPSIVIITPYFGKWPEWFDLFLVSCRYNPTVNWHFFTDCPIPSDAPQNTTFTTINFDSYKDVVSRKLDISFNPQSPYKLCDLKPAYGYIHSDIIKDYDFWGFGDIDVIYGNIRREYTDKLLNKYDLLSTHWDRISGHLCILRNTPYINEAFKKIPEWKKLFSQNDHLGLDESKFSKVFLRHKKYPSWLRSIYRLKDRYQRRAFFKEQYSTPLTPKPWHNRNWEHPESWKWLDGKLTNALDGDREFLYLHFMNWKSSTWLHKSRGEKAAWEDLRKLNFVRKEDALKGFSISRKGFHSLKSSS
ncbi:hypothetical protein M3P05_20000 [Sansalvadorimonas sp. 2012CJ34-2]|uniref:Uncharacterized protein n=1 Tax=Parendozoicomonas callyspongiae TaxID=2942213 RepID=A0ABT0PLG2_9GAMM|nr:DUF6625 family protein [Sansalvadorimonas sp. 2012CJ34-2]MCL6272208.1 hypothetical protein [Sansalvadorimonas sp. 2012CJ34-2]